MTRLFDALSKARSAQPARGPARPPAPLAIAAVRAGPAEGGPPRGGAPAAPDDGARRRIVPFGAAAELRDRRASAR